LFVGVDRSTDFFKKCEFKVRELDIVENVIFLDTVSDIQNYYSLTDVIINSRRDAEPFGLTVIESMMMKKPVLALDKGGPIETIIDGQTGWLVSEGNVNGYFNGMK